MTFVDNDGAVDTDFELAAMRLARLSPIQYERERRAEADRLKVRVSFLDDRVKLERRSGIQQEQETDGVDPGSDSLTEDGVGALRWSE